MTKPQVKDVTVLLRHNNHVARWRPCCTHLSTFLWRNVPNDGLKTSNWRLQRQRVPAAANLSFYSFSLIIIHMKKLLDSDWLRAVQFKCNTSAKSVTPVQKVKHQCKLHIVILDYDLQKDIEKIVGQWSLVNGNDQNFVQKLWKIFSRMRKKGLQETSCGTFSTRIFSCLYY